MEIRATEGELANGAGSGDGPMLPELLAQIPPRERIGTVPAGGADDTRTCHAAIAARQTAAVTPIRRNGRPWRETTPGAQARNDILRATQHLGAAVTGKVGREPSRTA